MSAVTLGVAVESHGYWVLKVYVYKKSLRTVNMFISREICFFFQINGVMEWMVFDAGPCGGRRVDFSVLGRAGQWSGLGVKAERCQSSWGEMHELHAAYWSAGSGDQQCSSADEQAVNLWPLAASGFLGFVNLSGPLNDAGGVLLYVFWLFNGLMINFK